MREYEVEITETLQKVIKIKAESEEDAYRKVSDGYGQGKIVLGSEDFIGKEITCR
jgi:hypothetical protein